MRSRPFALQRRREGLDLPHPGTGPEQAALAACERRGMPCACVARLVWPPRTAVVPADSDAAWPCVRPCRAAPQEIQAHPWFMQGLEPGALNFNDAIVQVPCCCGPGPPPLGSAGCSIMGCSQAQPLRSLTPTAVPVEPPLLSRTDASCADWHCYVPRRRAWPTSQPPRC